MFWKWFWKALAILMVLAVFAAGGVLIYRAGYTSGAASALWEAAEGGEVPPDQLPPQTSPYYPPYYAPYPPHRVFFPGLSLFLGFILLLFLFGGIGRLVRYSIWRSQGMPYPHHWGPGWHKYHHPRHADEAGPGDEPSRGSGPEDPGGSSS
jgi:hypothetical protein